MLIKKNVVEKNKKFILSDFLTEYNLTQIAHLVNRSSINEMSISDFETF